jgi:hypothetical protein
MQGKESEMGLISRLFKMLPRLEAWEKLSEDCSRKDENFSQPRANWEAVDDDAAEIVRDVIGLLREYKNCEHGRK